MQEAEALYRRALEGVGTRTHVDAENSQQPGSFLWRSRQDAASRGHVPAGAGRLREGVGTRAHVNVEHSQQLG